MAHASPESSPRGLTMGRDRIAGLILDRLQEVESGLRSSYKESKEGVGNFVVDDLLPEELALEVYRVFPRPREMVFNNTIRERKYIAAQMDRFSPLLEEVLFAFQDGRVVDLVARICGIGHLQADKHLYAGGISLMDRGCYLNPHLDNSHDKDRRRWRALNLLYYVSPDWEAGNGGNLEIWPGGVKQPAQTIVSRFNRLAVMTTHSRSWHSVSPVLVDRTRCCVSNYYFSKSPPEVGATFHVTKFRARPGHVLQDLLLQCDGVFRSALRKLRKGGIRRLTHVYEKTQ